METKPKRNEPCPCRSGKKYKRCCGKEDEIQLNPNPNLGVSGLGGLGQAGASGMGDAMGLDAGGMDPTGAMGGAGGGIGGLGGIDPSQFDPAYMQKMMAAFQRLPRGQLQRFQSVFQKAMRGEDVGVEMETLTRTLPPSLQQLMGQNPMTGAPMGGEEESQAAASGEEAPAKPKLWSKWFSKKPKAP